MNALNPCRRQPDRSAETDTAGKVEYVVGGAKGLGASHIVFGCLLITFGSIGAALNTADFFISTAIWTGLMYLVTGILGVVSSHRNNKCTAVGFLVMSCLCILMSIGGMLSASLALGWEHWSTFSGPVGCYYDWQYDRNICDGIDTARSAVDAANLLGAMVEMGLCIASIVVSAYAISKARREGDGSSSCCSCCGRGSGQEPAYQTLHEVRSDGTLYPVQNLTQLQMASAPSQPYVISTQVPTAQGRLQQGATRPTGRETPLLVHVQQQQATQYHQQQQQQQNAAAMTHAQMGTTSPPPAYNNQSEC